MVDRMMNVVSRIIFVHQVAQVGHFHKIDFSGVFCRLTAYDMQVFFPFDYANIMLAIILTADSVIFIIDLDLIHQGAGIDPVRRSVIQQMTRGAVVVFIGVTHFNIRVDIAIEIIACQLVPVKTCFFCFMIQIVPGIVPDHRVVDFDDTVNGTVGFDQSAVIQDDIIQATVFHNKDIRFIRLDLRLRKSQVQVPVGRFLGTAVKPKIIRNLSQIECACIVFEAEFGGNVVITVVLADGKRLRRAAEICIAKRRNRAVCVKRQILLFAFRILCKDIILSLFIGFLKLPDPSFVLAAGVPECFDIGLLDHLRRHIPVVLTDLERPSAQIGNTLRLSVGNGNHAVHREGIRRKTYVALFNSRRFNDDWPALAEMNNLYLIRIGFRQIRKGNAHLHFCLRLDLPITRPDLNIKETGITIPWRIRITFFIRSIRLIDRPHSLIVVRLEFFIIRQDLFYLELSPFRNFGFRAVVQGDPESQSVKGRVICFQGIAQDIIRKVFCGKADIGNRPGPIFIFFSVQEHGIGDILRFAVLQLE